MSATLNVVASRKRRKKPCLQEGGHIVVNVGSLPESALLRLEAERGQRPVVGS